jgi:hypothetical protein
VPGKYLGCPMKCAYEAANGVEAHMIANMLEQHSIASRIDGEYLSGAVGELPASGLVRVMVEDERYEEARQIIREWEAKSPPPSRTPVTRRTLGPVWFVAGMIVAVTAMSWMYRSRALIAGRDLNGDGKLDETYTYDNGRLAKVEGDANLDGKIDYILTYDSNNLPFASQMDLNFDGVFELKGVYERSNPKRVDIDWDGNGRVDRREDYASGVLSTVTYFGPDGESVVKRDRYRGGLLAEAEFDADGDGVLETTYQYDRYGEVIEARRR